MDVNLRKTATDTAYIVVGVGVLGFQQAQVRRRDAIARASTLRRDARGTLRQQTDKIKTRTEGCASNLADLGSSIGSTVGGTVGETVSNTVGAVSSQVKAGADAVSTQVKAGADADRVRPIPEAGSTRSSATSACGSSRSSSSCARSRCPAPSPHSPTRSRR